ncbi:MAG: substrate-binding domain-containing protein, partial [Faecalibacterium sp.]|nr:substrate-binding domain-containing protein [Faecalibacterium sp.]
AADSGAADVALLNAGNGLFIMAAQMALITIAARNPLGAITTVAWGNGVSALGSLTGAAAGMLANSAAASMPTVRAAIPAVLLLVFAAYVPIGLKRFTFAGVIDGIDPVLFNDTATTENIDAQYRTEYSIKALTDAGKEVECLYEYLDNWDQTTAQQDVANALSQYGDKIEVVFCNNDAMALGALQSIQQANRTVGKDIYLVGVDALTEAVQDVLDGNMTGTVLNDDVGQATKAAEATQLFVEGKDVEQFYWVDYVKVTKDNASQYIK